jgi:ferredoxin-like protein FixX
METDIEDLLHDAEVNIHVEPCILKCNRCRVVCEERKRG